MLHRGGSRLVGVAVVMAMAAGSVYAVGGPASAASPGRQAGDSFRIPAAATVRPLGGIPPGPCAPQVSQICQGEPDLSLLQNLQAEISNGGLPMDVTGLGIPVGGVGAGSFMINQAGTFGPWDFGGSQDATWEMRILPQAAFHFREQLGSSTPIVRTLATKGPTVTGSQGAVPLRSWGSPLPAWNLLQPGQGRYAALYPFGWISYHIPGAATDVSTRFFSPIVAGEDRRTSLPVVYFDVRLANHKNKTDSVSVMFTMPNAPDHVGTVPASVRQGFESSFVTDPRSGVRAVTLSANDPGNTADAQNSAWTIAAKPNPGQTVSYTTSWDASGDGSDVYAPFEASGSLPDGSLDSSHSAGAISVSAKLRPGEVTTIPFALTWDFPQVGFDNNQTIWMRRYTDFYGAKETATNHYIAGSYAFQQSFHIADDALASGHAALAAVESWWRRLADNPDYPLVLRTAALNQLYQLVFNNSFWEGGLVSNTVTPTAGSDRLGSAIPGTHVFNTADSTAAWLTLLPDFAPVNSANEMDVDSYGYLAYDLLFPNLERDRLRALVEAIERDRNVVAVHNPLYVVAGDPLITWDDTGTTSPTPGAIQFTDIPSKDIYRLYAYARLAHDQNFLQYAYPAMLESLGYLQQLIAPGTSLPQSRQSCSGPPPHVCGGLEQLFANTYDIIPVNGYDIYDSELYLLSLEIVIDAGQRLGRPPAALAPLRADLAQAKSEFENLFWDSAHQLYRYTPNPIAPADDTVMLDSFFAQHIAEQLRLPDLVNPAHYQLQLANTYNLFASPIGSFNMAPATVPTRIAYWPNGTGLWPAALVSNNFIANGPYEETEIWPGTNYFAAATYYAAGSRFRNAALRNDGMQMAFAVANQIWQVDCNGFVFDGPEAWGHYLTTTVYRYPAYARLMSVWDLINAIKPIPPESHHH